MMFVIDKPQMQRIITIVRDDRTPRGRPTGLGRVKSAWRCWVSNARLRRKS
jgi:hypothetical protein